MTRNHHFLGPITATPEAPPRLKRRPIGIKSVACPECKAGASILCVTATGTPRDGFHQSRRNMAVRASESWKVLPPEPEPVCPAGSLTCPVCGQFVTTRQGQRAFSERPTDTYYRRHRDGDIPCSGGERTI